MDKEPFNVHDFHHGKYEFSKTPNGSNRNPIQFGIPTISDLDIEKSIDNVLSSEEYMKQINDFILEDEKERYVRALLNRLNTIIKYMERASDDDTYQEIIIAIAKGDLNTIYDYEQYLDEETFEILKGYRSKGDINE
jgi:hypothetical protein